MMDRQFAFRGFRFDPRTGELWGDGKQSRLTPRAAAVFTMLAESAPKLVSKQELFAGVWSGLAVSDDALTSCIQELRQALGDDARAPRYIETRHRRGYRLLEPVTVVGGTIAVSHYLTGRYEESFRYASDAARVRPGFHGAHRLRCASLARTGRIAEARSLLAAVRSEQPLLSLEWIRANVPYQTPELMERFLDGMRIAGLGES